MEQLWSWQRIPHHSTACPGMQGEVFRFSSIILLSLVEDLPEILNDLNDRDLNNPVAAFLCHCLTLSSS